ncbi:MAG TPA: hypothetical protein C5S50_02465 [Methanosarcinaceae archaeon]|nr:hypothetical protein [Methanosarcinaceae archaeon]
MMERSSLLQKVRRRGIFSLFLLFLLIPQVAGIGVGASPDKIEFGEVSPKEGGMRELYVINTGDTAERILLTVEGVNLTIDSLEFDLDAQESRAVTISVDQEEAGKYDGSILITACSSGVDSGGLGLGAGVRVPISFIVKDSSYIKILLATGGLLIAIATVVSLGIRRLKV